MIYIYSFVIHKRMIVFYRILYYPFVFWQFIIIIFFPRTCVFVKLPLYWSKLCPTHSRYIFQKYAVIGCYYELVVDKKHQYFLSNMSMFYYRYLLLTNRLKHRLLAFDVDITIFLVNMFIYINCIDYMKFPFYWLL